MSIELMMPSNHHPLSPPSSYASQVMLKILQATLQQYVNWQNFQMFSLSLEKAEEPEIKLPTSAGSSKKQESSRKTSTSASLTTLKPLTMCITTHFRKFFKRWEYQTILPASWETCVQVKKQQLEPHMEQQTGSKLGKEYIKAVYCPSYLFNLYAEYIMGNAGLDEAQAGIKIAGRNINNLRYALDTNLGRKWRRTKELLDEGERGEWKSWLKAQHSEN